MNTNLMVLLTFSYDVRDYQIIDAPKWATGESFDVSFTPDKPESFPKPGEADVKIMETLMDSKSLFLTPNTETVYNLMWLDLKDGPLVLETPPNILGIVDDFWFQYVGDTGNVRVRQIHRIAVRAAHHHLLLAVLLEQVLFTQGQHISQRQFQGVVLSAQIDHFDTRAELLCLRFPGQR